MIKNKENKQKNMKVTPKIMLVNNIKNIIIKKNQTNKKEKKKCEYQFIVIFQCLLISLSAKFILRLITNESEIMIQK